MIVSPFIDLIQKHHSFHWTFEHQDAFEQLNTALMPVLHISNPYKDFALESDASQFIVSAQLVRGSPPVAYCSKNQIAIEQAYMMHERELLAIHLSTKKFRFYFYERKTTIYMDHEPLVHIFM